MHRFVMLGMVLPWIALSCSSAESNPVQRVVDAEASPVADARVAMGSGGSSGSVVDDAASSGGAAPADEGDARIADAQDATPPGDAESTPIPVIDGVVLWLDASRGVTVSNDRVSNWTDQSTMHNNAAPPNAGIAPSLSDGAVNGRAAVHFDATRKTVLLVPDAASLHFGTGDFTIELVVGYHNKSKGGMPVDHLDGWGYVFNKMVGNRLGIGLMGNWPVSETAPIGSQFGCETTEQGGSLLSKAMGYNDGVARLWGMVRTDTTVTLRRNGVVDKSGKWSPPVDVDAMGTPPVSIGARLYQGQTGASFPLDGDVAEVVAVKGTLAAAQLMALEDYLRTKYRLQ